LNSFLPCSRSHYHHMSAINQSTMSSNALSICIPRAVSHVTEEQVTHVFNAFFGGEVVSRVDMRERNDRNTGEQFWIVFVHFNDEARAIAQRGAMGGLLDQSKFIADIDADKQVKITYDRQWFWKCRKNNAKSQSKPKSSGPRLMTEEDEQEFAEFQRRRAAIRQEQAAASSSAQTLEEHLAQNPVGRPQQTHDGEVHASLV